MAINVDGYGATAPAAGPAQRLQNDARQSRWLYEVEHAMLLQAGKKPSDAGRGAASDEGRKPEPGRQVERERERDVARLDATAAQCGAAVAQRAPALPPAETPGGGNGPTAAAALDGPERAVAAVRTGAAAGADGVGSAHGVAATLAPAGAVEAAVAVSPVAREHGMPSPSAVQSLYGAAGAVLPRGASGGGAALTVQKMAAVAPGWTLAASAASDPAAVQRTGSGQSEPADEAPAPAERREQADGEQYASRLLHVYRDADGVQAWLRDAGLGTAQARQVAQAMAVELGSAGAPLAALTVNGQRLPLAPAAGAGRQQRDDYDGDSAAPPSAEPTSPWTINANGAV